MLVISRRIGESFFIGDDMEVTVVDITGTKVVLGVAAPREIPVARLAAPGPAEAAAASINEHGYGRKVKNRLEQSDS